MAGKVAKSVNGKMPGAKGLGYKGKKHHEVNSMQSEVKCSEDLEFKQPGTLTPRILFSHNLAASLELG